MRDCFIRKKPLHNGAVSTSVYNIHHEMTNHSQISLITPYLRKSGEVSVRIPSKSQRLTAIHQDRSNMYTVLRLFGL